MLGLSNHYNLTQRNRTGLINIPLIAFPLFQFHEEAVSCILQMIGKDPLNGNHRWESMLLT